MNALQLPLLFQAAFCEPVALEISTYYNLAAFLLPRMTGKASASKLNLAISGGIDRKAVALQPGCERLAQRCLVFHQ